LYAFDAVALFCADAMLAPATMPTAMPAAAAPPVDHPPQLVQLDP
jgi:hypothetical protein